MTPTRTPTGNCPDTAALTGNNNIYVFVSLCSAMYAIDFFSQEWHKYWQRADRGAAAVCQVLSKQSFPPYRCLPEIVRLLRRHHGVSATFLPSSPESQLLEEIEY